MFFRNKCITIYSIILLHFATGVFGMLMDGDWMAEGDPKIAKVNALLDGPCKGVLDVRIAQMRVMKLTAPFKAVSMIYIQPGVDDLDKHKHMGVVALESSTPPDSSDPKKRYFTMVLDYLNLDGEKIDDKHRLHLASNTIQYNNVNFTLQDVQSSAKSHLLSHKVMKMARPFNRVRNKTFNQLKGAFSRSINSTIDEASSSASSETERKTP